jgi:hypothetical protein
MTIPYSAEYLTYHALLRELRAMRQDGASVEAIAEMQARVDAAKAALDGRE